MNNRNGFSDIYDESEKIEDIRKREREIRSGGIKPSFCSILATRILTALGYVLSVYDEYDVDGNLMHVLLAIHSTPLLDLLRQVITFFPGDEFDILRGKDSTDDTVTFIDPYMIFFAYRAQLRQTLKGDFAEDAKQHVRMLLDFLKSEHRKAPSCLDLP